MSMKNYVQAEQLQISALQPSAISDSVMATSFFHNANKGCLCSSEQDQSCKLGQILGSSTVGFGCAIWKLGIQFLRIKPECLTHNHGRQDQIVEAKTTTERACP